MEITYKYSRIKAVEFLLNEHEIKSTILTWIRQNKPEFKNRLATVEFIEDEDKLSALAVFKIETETPTPGAGDEEGKE